MNIKMNIKILIFSLLFAVNANAWSLDDKSLLDDRLLPSISPSIWLDPCWALMSPGPCEDNLVAWWKDEWSDDGTQLLDLSTTATHEAMQGQSLLFSGAQYGTVDLTGYEYLNEEVWTIEFEFYNSVAIDRNTVNEHALHIGDSAFTDGVALGGGTALLTDEILYTLSGAGGRSAYTSSTAAIGVGKHDIKLQWDGTNYEIWLDGVRVDNATSGTQAVWLFNELFIGARGDFGALLNNTSLYNITLKNEAGTTIWQNYLANGSGNVATSVIGPDVTLTGFTMDDDWISSALYGSTKHNELGYSVGVTDGVELWDDDLATDQRGNWTYNGDGTWTSDGSQSAASELYVSGVNEIGDADRFVWEIISISAGTVGASNRGTTDYESNVGEYVDDLIAGAGGWVGMVADINFAGTIRLSSIQKLPQGYIPASLTTPTQDIYGNDLTYSGRAAQPLDVFGYTVGWDGATTTALDTAVPLSGNFTAEFYVDVTGTGNNCVLGQSASADNYIIFDVTNSRMLVKIGGDYTVFSNIIAKTGIFTVSRVDDNITVIGGGVTQTLGITTTTDVEFSSIGTSNSGSRLNGVLQYVKLYNASNTLTNHWVIESGSQLNQGIIYDVVGGNHATMVGHTTPAFDTLFQPSYLAQYGGVEVENLLKYSEDIGSSEYGVAAGATKLGTDIIVFDSQSSSRLYNEATNRVTTPTIGDTYRFKAKLSAATTASKTINLLILENGGSYLSSTKTVSVEDNGGHYEVEYTVANVYPLLCWVTNVDSEAGQVVATELQLTKKQSDGTYAEYIQTIGTAIPLSIAPNGVTDLPNSFDSIHDAPEDVFIVNTLATVEIEEADLTGFWINKTTGAANSVDPYDIEWIPDYQFSNETDILLYSEDVTETCDRRTEQYMSIPFPGEIKLIDAADDYILDNAGNYIIQ